MAEFAPASALYESAGFIACGPFADYQPSDDNCFMTLALDGAASAKGSRLAITTLLGETMGHRPRWRGYAAG